MLFNISHAENSPVVSILTCSPGEQVYELFGHTAIRLVDEDENIDCVFNYGLFSFDEPNFIWRFILGETDYLLDVIDYDSFISSYAMRGSSVTEQILNLDSTQIAQLTTALLDNLKPANKKYRYNFLFNNCTTKARDKVVAAMDGCDGFCYRENSPWQKKSFRDIIHAHTKDCPWYALGMDMLLGASADTVAGREGSQFAPLLFMQDLQLVQTKRNGDFVPLVSAENVLLAGEEKQPSRNNFTPFNVSLLLLIFTFVVMLCERRSKKTYLAWDILLMGLQGLAGLLLLFMALFSQHPAVDTNLLLMWINPLPLFLIPLLVCYVKKHKKPSFMWIQVVMVAAFVVASPFLPQYFPMAVYPCALALIIRSLFHIYKSDICALD